VRRRTMHKDDIRALVRQHPEYKDGRLSGEQVEEIAAYLAAHNDEIFEERLKAEVRREAHKHER
jgi:hypothetical protein